MGGPREARELIYRGYTQAELDAQYNNAPQAPGGDPEVYFARYREASRRARERFAGRLDLAYGEGPRERLDVFPAAAGGPTWIFIHGGFWRRLDKSDFSFLAASFVPAGISLACVGYALAPQVGVAEIVRQCRTAAQWVFEHAHEWGGRPQRIFAGGHSVGGQLAALVAATHPVVGLSSISGLHDLEPVLLSYVNEWARLRRDELPALNPVDRIPARSLPLLAAVGSEENDEFKRQNALFAEAWRTRGYPTAEMTVPGANHYTIAQMLGDPASTLARKLHEQILSAAAV